MKESISYSFLLNIIILFIFVCAAIVTGIFSYYKAFRANTIIINEIEKYEGYNCNSMSKIASKLNSISYNLPFDVKCKAGEDNCATDDLNNYKVYFYYVDEFDDIGGYTILNEANSFDGSVIRCDGDNNCQMLYTYQYGVYTYMYTNLPVVSGLLRIPVFSKTAQLHDFRNLTSDGLYIYDVDSIPKTFIDDSSDFLGAVYKYATQIKDNSKKKEKGEEYGVGLDYFGNGIKKILDYSDLNLRDDFNYNNTDSENADALRGTGKKKCGTIPDWSMF